MKIIYMILGVSLSILSGCAESGSSVYHSEQARDLPVCGEIDGEKQTFPSITELSNFSGAVYLHDGPCYE